MTTHDTGTRIALLLTKLVVNMLALLVADKMFDGIMIDSFQTFLAAAVVLALANTYIKPFILVLTLPFNIVTLGLFTIIINGFLLWFAGWLLRPAFQIDSFWTAVWAALVMSLISILLNWFLNPPKMTVRIDRR